MPAHLRPALSRLAPALALLAAPPTSPAAEPAPAPTTQPLAVVDRVITQDREQGRRVAGLPEQYSYWQVDYRLRNDGPAPLDLAPADISAAVEGWVSNSRIASHASPRPAAQALRGPDDLSAFAEVIESPDEALRCRERATLRVWADGSPAPNAATAAPIPTPPLHLDPGGLVRARLRLEHHHFLYGAYDPLLGPRTFKLRLGPATLTDALPLDRARRMPRPALTWPRPAPNRMDTRHFVSAPDSLHLQAHLADQQSFRFEEQSVPYATKYRLRFWYLIAPGTYGDCHARVLQYRDAPGGFKTLYDATRDETLTVVGRWTRVERLFTTEADANRLALDFRISSVAEVGELWIDDVTLEPVDTHPGGP